MQVKRFLLQIFSPFFIFVLVILWSAAATRAEEESEKSLYERLGGEYAVATVVDDFIDRLLVNDVLNANPRINEARQRVPKAGLKFQVTMLVCQVTGGPQKYTGRSMKEAHQHLNITEQEWQAMAADFKKTLDHFKVPEHEQEELFTIVGSTKPDIVVSKSDEPKKSLYERLGGVYAIATVVDDFIERLLVNDVLNANPRINEARQRVPKAGLKARVTALVCQVTGGPEVYTGRSMKESHQHLNITEKEWQAMAADFKTTLDKFHVPQLEQDELFAIVGSTKPDIVISTR